MPLGRLIAIECAVESPTMTRRRGNVAEVTGTVTPVVVGATVSLVLATGSVPGVVCPDAVAAVVDVASAPASNATSSLLVSSAASNTAGALLKYSAIDAAIATVLATAQPV